jgi:hypothetical protein
LSILTHLGHWAGKFAVTPNAALGRLCRTGNLHETA